MADDLFGQLHEDHEEVKGILAKMLDAGENARSARRGLSEQLVQTLKPHMKAEEEAFYSELIEEPETKELALQAFEEHHVAEMVLDELLKLDTGNDSWQAKAQVLKEIVEHHIEEEEEEIFEAVEEVLEEEELEEMFQNFLTIKQGWKGKRAA